MAKGDKVTRQYFGRRFDGVDLYRYAVPNIRISPKPMGEPIEDGEEEKYWQPPRVEIIQDDTGVLYSSAIDIETAGHSYTETDTPVEGETGDLTVNDTLEMLNELGVDTDDQ